MERSLFFLIMGLGILWLILDEVWGEKKIISRIVKGVTGS